MEITYDGDESKVTQSVGWGTLVADGSARAGFSPSCTRTRGRGGLGILGIAYQTSSTFNGIRHRIELSWFELYSSAQYERVPAFLAGPTWISITSAGEVGQAMGYAGKSLNAQLSQPAPLPSWVPTSTNRNIKIFLDILNNRVHGIIERRRREPNTDLDDVLSRLLNAKDDNGDALTAQEIRDAQPCAVVGQEPARF